MAKALDLEEQEQLDQIKHFWNRFGGWISTVALLVAGAVLAWYGWQAYQRNQASQAALLYEELQRAAQTNDSALVERALADMQSRFGRTLYASQAGLLAAKVLSEQGKAEAARTALNWVVDRNAEPGLAAVARLRLAGELLNEKSYDEALKQLDAKLPTEFEGVVADRRGDILVAQGKRDEAVQAYKKAWELVGTESGYRRIVEYKLNATGLDPKTLSDAVKAAPPAAVQAVAPASATP